MNHALWNRSQNCLLAPTLEIADGFYARLRGLLGRNELPAENALLITKCRQVHMLFMKFPIDVLFCSRGNQVVHVEENLQPWRISPTIRDANYAIELQAGAVSRLAIRVGDLVEVRSDSPS